MIKYYLKNKQNEIINSVVKNTIYEAITYFSLCKKISEKQLLDIFLVTDLR